MKHWPIVSAAMDLSSVSADVIYRAMRASVMEYGVVRMELSESISSFLRFARKLLRVKHERQVPTCRKYHLPDHVAKVCPNVVCFNCDQLGHTFSDCKEENKASAVFAKRTATTPLIVNYLGGGALKKLTRVIMMLLPLPFQSLDRHSLSRSLLLMSLLPMARLLQSLNCSLYLMFLLHSLLRNLLLMYLLHLPVFSCHRNHHRRHLLVSLHHCPRTPQSSPPHSPRSLLSLHSSLSHHKLRNRLSPSFRLLNRRPCLFLCPKSLLFRRASFLALLLCLIYSLSLQLIRNVLLLLIKLLLRWRFLRILALQLHCAHHRFLSVLHLLELHRNSSLPC